MKSAFVISSIKNPGTRCVRTESRLPAPAQAFTLVELLVVISIMGLLAGLFLGVGSAATRKGKESRVRAELNQYATLIEGYEAKVGSPPPSSEIRGNPTNHLFYELSGTIFTNQGAGSGRFFLLGRDPSTGLTVSQINSIFGADGFANSARSPRNVKFKAEFRPSAVRSVVANGVAVEVLVAPIPPPVNPLPNGPAILTTTTGKFYPWYYDSASTNRVNADGYDLWTEVEIGKKIFRFSNWEPGPVAIGP